MRKTFKKSILLFTIALLGTSAMAQQNNIKLNTVPFGWGELRLGYERQLTPKSSVQINLGMKIPGKLPTQFYDETVVNDYGGTVDISNRVTGFTVSGEYRLYTSTSKDAPRGFYFAPYLKYNKYTVTTSATIGYEANPTEYADLTPNQQATAVALGNGNYQIDVTGIWKGSLRQAGGGVMIGYQWLISDRVSLDWNFFGIGIESDMLKLEISTDVVDVDYQTWANEIEVEVADFAYVGDKTEVTVESDKIIVKGGPFTLPMPRFGLSLGVAF